LNGGRVMAADLYSEFAWRGLVYESTEGARELLAGGPVTAYIGFDPTAPSLHVGSLLPIMALARLQRFGHHAIAIAGGGTGMIGDPSGKSQERALLSIEEIEENLTGIRTQLAHFLDFDAPSNPARIVNNADWLGKLNLVEFLRDIGKYFTVNYMLAKESVRRRLEQEEGISYTEFTYLMLQAYDFLVLYDRYGCRLQMGGSDQWGNITAGCELIRRLRGASAHGLVLPLVTTTSGVKFGKTEITRLIIGSNPFYGYSHFNRTLDQCMLDWYTRDRKMEVLHACERHGINTWQLHYNDQPMADFARYRAERSDVGRRSGQVEQRRAKQRRLGEPDADLSTLEQQVQTTGSPMQQADDPRRRGVGRRRPGQRDPAGAPVAGWV
jgi:tyrosyl-tRNA synthetase